MAYFDDYGIMSVEEFIDSCNSSELEEVLTWAKDNQYLTQHSQNMLDQEWIDALNTLKTKRVYLTLNEEQIIKNLSKKF